MEKENKSLGRWKELRTKDRYTGGALYVCLSCGRQHHTKDLECPSMAKMDYAGRNFWQPCSSWPLSPEEYMNKTMSEKSSEAFFSGVVIMPDGPIEVSVPIPEELARQIAILAVEYDLCKKNKKKQAIEAEHGQSEDAVDALKRLIATQQEIQQSKNKESGIVSDWYEQFRKKLEGAPTWIGNPAPSYTLGATVPTMQTDIKHLLQNK